jgi:predicted NBD/HSP70 family sugar kinase
MRHPLILVPPRFAPVLDGDFRPAILGNRAFRQAVKSSGRSVPLVLALERAGGAIAARKLEVFAPGSAQVEANLPYAERIVKMMLWQYGGFRIVVAGPPEVGEHIKHQYAPGGPLAFDAQLMSDVYDRPFVVEAVPGDLAIAAHEPQAPPLGRHLNGCRIGFDAGASDHKVAAVVDGEVVFSEEVPWLPARQSDPSYHYDAIAGAFRKAAGRMPRVDAIGVSSAGIYIDNQVRVASLFRAVPRDVFQRRVRGLFLDLQKEFGGVPMVVANDGDVAALAGSMSLDDTRVLGIALGSSEAGGYVTAEGNITSWLNELAFPPVDYQPDAPVDEWSGDRGCGGEYFSQKAAIRLAGKAGIPLDPAQTPAQQLAHLQETLARGDDRARKVFVSIGTYMGYGIAHYAEFYDLKHVMLMGRVVSGEGGNIILDCARRILAADFPEVSRSVAVHLPDEKNRRVGQAVAAASLPWLG